MHVLGAAMFTIVELLCVMLWCFRNRSMSVTMGSGQLGNRTCYPIMYPLCAFALKGSCNCIAS